MRRCGYPSVRKENDMPRQFATISAAALLAFGALAGCSLQKTPPAQQPAAVQPAGYEEHNDADVAYAQRMIPLQQQAVALSEALLAKPGVDPDVAGIASAIAEGDRPEIAQLQGWLREWGVPGGDRAQGDVAALASERYTADITAADPGQAAKLFLTRMLTNREQTLALSETEIDDGIYRATVAAAGGNQATQQRQISTMRTLLGVP